MLILFFLLNLQIHTLILFLVLSNRVSMLPSLTGTALIRSTATSIARFSGHHSVFILHNFSSASRATGLFSLLETLSGLHLCNDFYREVGFRPHSLEATSWFPLMAPPPLLNLWLFQGLILGPFLFFLPTPVLGASIQSHGFPSISMLMTTHQPTATLMRCALAHKLPTQQSHALLVRILDATIPK